MTPEQQRIAIARFLGFTNIEHERLKTCVLLIGRRSGAKSEIPDYLNDLNAMHEAEQYLSPGQFWHYYERIISDFDLYEGEANPMIIHATASHRAECFLKTLNLWEESK